MSLRELGEPPNLEYALAYLDLLAEHKPEKLEPACVRWHGRLETEATFLSLGESQLALAALASLCEGSEMRFRCCGACSGGSHRSPPHVSADAWHAHSMNNLEDRSRLPSEAAHRRRSAPAEQPGSG